MATANKEARRVTSSNFEKFYADFEVRPSLWQQWLFRMPLVFWVDVASFSLACFCVTRGMLRPAAASRVANLAPGLLLVWGGFVFVALFLPVVTLMQGITTVGP